MSKEFSFEELFNIAKYTKRTAEYMKSFQCEHGDDCYKQQRGGVCNSCWVRNWAIDFLKKINSTKKWW